MFFLTNRFLRMALLWLAIILPCPLLAQQALPDFLEDRPDYLVDGTAPHISDLIAVEQALEQLVQDQKWAIAALVGRRYLDSRYHRPRQLYLTIIALRHTGHHADARSLLDQALTFYPDYLPLLSLAALYSALAGKCQDAQHHFERYRNLAGPLIDEAVIRHYDNLCPWQWRNQLDTRLSVIRTPRTGQIASQDDIIAEQGSLLDDICTALMSLCPASRQFQAPQQPPRKTVGLLHITFASQKQITVRDSLQINHEQIHHIAGYRHSSAAIMLAWQRQINPKLRRTIGAKSHMTIVPQTASFDRILSEEASIFIEFDSILTPIWIQKWHSEMSRGRINGTGHHSHSSSVHHSFRLTPTIEIGGNYRIEQLVPSHSDLYGQRLRMGGGLIVQSQLYPFLSVLVIAERHHTRFDKILPFLTAPHQVTEDDIRLRFTILENQFSPFEIFFEVSQFDSASQNPLQRGKNRNATIGLSITY